VERRAVPFCFLTHSPLKEGLLFIYFFCAVAWFISRCIFLLSGFCDADHKAGRERERGVERPVQVRVRTAGEWNGSPWTPHARGAGQTVQSGRAGPHSDSIK
jgi:hypothetical protein